MRLVQIDFIVRRSFNCKLTANCSESDQKDFLKTKLNRILQKESICQTIGSRQAKIIILIIILPPNSGHRGKSSALHETQEDIGNQQVDFLARFSYICFFDICHKKSGLACILCPQTCWLHPGRVATAYSTDKYKYQRMKKVESIEWGNLLVLTLPDIQ